MTLSLETIRRAPKVLLHDHLDGGLRPRTIVELAAETGYGGLPMTDPDELGSLDPPRRRPQVARAVPRDIRPHGRGHADAGGDRPGRRRVRRGPGRGRRRLRRGPLRPRAVDGGRDEPRRRGRGGDSPASGSGWSGPRRRAGRSSSARWRPRCARRTGRSRSPSWRCVIATRAWSASTSPGPRPAIRPGAFADAFHRLTHASFHLTLHAGEGYGLPSIREALDLGAERLGHGVRIVDDIEVDADGHAPPRSPGRLRPRPADPARAVSDLERPHRPGRTRSPITRSTCSAGSASGSRSTPTTG